MSSVFGTTRIAQVYDQIKQIQETYKRSLYNQDTGVSEDSDYAEGIKTRGWGDLVRETENHLGLEITKKILKVIPKPEAEEVERFRALILSMDTVRGEETDEFFGDPIPVMQNTAMEYRKEALDLIVDRLVLEKPTDEDDADVIYIYDPVSKLRQTTALGGYKEEYDKANILDQKERMAEQILYEPIPDTIPRV